MRSRKDHPDQTAGDDRVLRRVAEQPAAAWDEFLERFAPTVFRVVCVFFDSYDRRMDLFVFVCQKLREDGMKRVRSYRYRPDAPCTFRSYLAVVVRNLALDFVRASEGRYRPFRFLDRLDETDRRIFEYNLRDRRPLEEVGRLLDGRHGIQIDAAELKRRSGRIEDAMSPNQRWRLLSRFWARRPPLHIDPVKDSAGTEATVPIRSELPDPATALDSKTAGEEMRRALERLEPRKRLALVLRYRDGLRVREAARVLQATEKQVEHWLSDGTAVIRDYLKHRRVLRDDLDPDQLDEMWGP